MTESGARSSLQVPFGLKDGRLFEPLQVENGLLCACVCPGCLTPLIARHSPAGKVRPHFAHASGAACSGGLESALHLAAKQLIADRQTLYFPELVASISGPGLCTPRIQRSAVVRAGVLAELQEVWLEEKVGAIRPDLIANTSGQDILVEIANTSFVTPEKLAHIRRQGIATMEVDVSDLVVLNFEELAKRLFEASQRSTWVFHPALAAAELELQTLLAADQDEDRSRWEKEQVDAAQRRAREAAREAQAERNRQEIHRIRAQRIAKTIAEPHAQKLARTLKVLGDEASEFLPLAVRGASSINAPPFVWQGYAFAGLIHPALRKGKPSLSADHLRTWLSERFAVDTSSSSSAVAVWDFLSGLADLGILHKSRKQEFIVTVPDIGGALAVVTDARENSVRELVWPPAWPSLQKARAVADVFAAIYGYRYCWERIAGLLPSVVQGGPPAAALNYYQHPAQGAMDASALRRYFLSTGFARLPN